jgi:hypothetical protein
MDPADLDAQLDRELKGLPGPRAPRTLLPRVLAATAAATARGPATGWLTWPFAWRLASVAVAMLVAAGLWLVVITPPEQVSAAATTAGEVATVLRVFWDVMFQPVATYIFILGLSLALACALAWAALEAALGGASR